MKPRILLAIHGPADPHTAVYLNNLRRAGALLALDCHVDLVSPDKLPFHQWHRLAPILLPVGLAARAINSYDIVIFHSYMGWAYHLLRGLPRNHDRARTITTFHGLEPLYFEAVLAETRRAGHKLSARFEFLQRTCLPALLRRSCRASDMVFCLNQREARYLIEHRWALPEQVAIVQNGVTEEFFTPRRYQPRATRMLFLGQWLLPKGIRYLAQAFTALALRHPDIELFCVGTGAPNDAVQTCFPESIRARVQVLPRVPHQELPGIIAAADLFVFPSLSEGSSHALLEAMASGLPIVTTAAGVAGELLTDGQDSLIVPFADADAIVTAVERLLGDPRLREQLGTGARLRAEGCRQDRADSAFASSVLGLLDREARRRDR